MHPFINTAIKAARLAGEIVMRGYERLDTITVSKKNSHELVTNIDIHAENVIIDTIHAAYPDHRFLCEEKGRVVFNEGDTIKGKDSDYYEWIIDPLDGTHNFIHGFGHFAISIALRYRNRIEHGVIYDPIRNDLFVASRGNGANKNDRRIRIGKKDELAKALMGTENADSFCPQFDLYHDVLKKLSSNCFGLRRTGSAALDLSYVASGQLDGFWTLGLNIWDMAAGTLLIKEAGGLVSDCEGKEDYFEKGNLICGNPKVFKALLTLIKPCFCR